MHNADGIHWGTGSSPTGLEGARDPIMAILPLDAPTIINEPEAQWHYAGIKRVRTSDALTIWRASPQARPADRFWDAHAFSRDVFINIDNHFQRTGMYPTDILLLNELNLDYERGDSKNDGGAFDTNPDNWPGLYRKLAAFMADLLQYCKGRAQSRGFTARWWYPGWAPGHGEMLDGIASLWVPGAKAYDGIVYHSYTATQIIDRDTRWYVQRFPDHPLCLGEWNTINWAGPHRLAEEVEIRGILRRLCVEFPRLSACYFIYRWEQDHKHEHDIEGNDDRLAIWDGRIDIWEPPVREIPVTVSQGIDVSNNNGTIDWDQVAASGIEFMYAKVSEGDFYIDRYLPYNWANARRVGLVRGGYHFARPSSGSAVGEANFFVETLLNNVGELQPGDFVVLDLEDENARGDLGQWTLDWLRTVTNLLGFKPMLYTGAWYLHDHTLNDELELAEYGLILAAYQPDQPPVPDPWTTIAMWQNDDATSVPGVTGDHDVFNGDLDQLRAYGKPGDVPVPDPVPDPTPDEETRTMSLRQWTALVNTAGYLRGDLATRLANNIAVLPSITQPKTDSQMKKDDWKAYAKSLETAMMNHTLEDRAIEEEMIRAGKEGLDE